MKGKSDNMWLYIVGILAILTVAGVINWSAFSVAPVTPAVVPGETVSAATCKGGETPSVVLKGVDVRTGAALTETNNIYQLKGDIGWLSWTQGTAITTFVPGNTYIIVPGISTSSFTGNAFGKPFEYSAPCRGEKSVELSQDATTFTGTFFNQNDAAAYAPISASTDATVSVKMQAGSKTVFGNTYLKDATIFSDIGVHRKAFPNCACVQANSTWADTVDVRSWLSTGEEMRRIPIPTILSAATGDTAYCFESPVVTDQATKQYFYLDIKNSVVADDGNINFYPGGMYLDQSGNLQWGCETDTGAAVGAAVKTVALDVTA